MGKTAIVYYSQHHGNTKKVLDAIASYDNDVTLIDVTEKHEVDLTGYDRIGFASGIYFGKFAGFGGNAVWLYRKIDRKAYAGDRGFRK